MITLIYGPGSAIFILFSFANEPSSLICSIPSLINVFLPISGGELILPLITKNLVNVPHVLVLTTASNSPFTVKLLCKVFSYVCTAIWFGFHFDIFDLYCHGLVIIITPNLLDLFEMSILLLGRKIRHLSLF